MTMSGYECDLALGEVTLGAPSRLAFRLTPSTIRAMLPDRTIGTYLLLHGRSPVYVGRSDSCLRNRLANHNHLDHATHVIWEPATTPWAAFMLEAYWYHALASDLINIVHPAIPADDARGCPFCVDYDTALTIALHPQSGTNANITERNQAS